MFVRQRNVYLRISPKRLTKMGEEFRNTESNNVEHHKPCCDSEKENVIQHKEDDVPETKSTAMHITIIQIHYKIRIMFLT